MRRGKKDQIDSIVFDDHARLEFLTGFRKRKLQKKETAKNKAKERERQERLQARKEHRQALKERAQENARLIEGTCRHISDDEYEYEESAGLSASDKGKGKATQEFEDEEQLATVTIVEEFDPEALRHGTSVPNSTRAVHPQSESSSNAQKSRLQTSQDEEDDGATCSGSSATQKDKRMAREKKIIPRKIAYETNAARRAARVQQRARKLEKADLAAASIRRKAGKAKKAKR